MRKKTLRKQRGFTLIELIVALGVFIAVLAIGMGGVLAMFGANKKSQALKSTINNLNFSLDSMSREITVGHRYHCGSGSPGSSFPKKDCPNPGGDWITFCSSEDQRIFYRFISSSGYLERNIIKTSNCVLDDDEDWMTEANPPVAEQWQRFTTPEVEIGNLKFYVSGSEFPELQPRILITLAGQAGSGASQTNFELQTTISQRTPDLSILQP